MLVVPNKNVVVINTNIRDKILSAIPHSRKFKGDSNLIAVPHGVDECLVLRNLGFRAVPSPILSYYKWPGRYPPMSHQRETAAFFVGHRKALCLSEPGTGKTASALWAADYLLKAGTINRVLIVCPLSTMRSVWGKELVTFLPHRNFTIITGTRERRNELLENPSMEFAIINHDGLKVVQDKLGMFDLIIYDEATALKNPSTERFRMFHLAVRKRNPWLWLLTGTPFSQTPVDAWALAKLVDSPTLTKTFTGFKDLVMNKISNFRWVPKKTALSTCRHVLQPSIRYTLDECVDLPQTVVVDRQTTLSPAQAKAFKDMQEKSRLVVQDVTAVNMAVMLQKLIQIVCVGYNTPVLTDSGWKPIQKVTGHDFLWDGVEWVTHHGVVYKGAQETIVCGGVRMTPEHKVLTTAGWKTARETVDGESSKKFSRAKVRLPDGIESSWFNDWCISVRSLVVPVRLWRKSITEKPVFTRGAPATSPKLWVPSWQRLTQNVAHQRTLYLGEHEAPLPKPKEQRLEKLWRAWDNCVRTLAAQLSSVLGRYGQIVPLGTDFGAQRQQRWLHPGELPVGNAPAASKQPAQQPRNQHPQRAHDCGVGSAPLGDKTSNPLCAAKPKVVGSEVIDVFDIVGCGPRNRFVVQGAHGETSIVHNCGVIYDDSGERHKIDATQRLDDLKELIDEAGDKVIIYVPLRGVQDWLASELRKDYDVGVVHGDVGLKERTAIFNAFQTTSSPQVLLAHPRVASHGLTLTAAKTVVWYAPIYSLDQYAQANARIRRIGTQGKTMVVHLYATAFEKELYQRLKLKQRVLGDFLNLVNGINYGG